MEQLPDELQDAIGALSRLLLTDDGLDAALHRVAGLAVLVVEACDCCGVSLALNGKIESRVTTSAVAQRIDDAQYSAGNGPCLVAVRTGEMVNVGSIRDETRWPEFARRATAEGVHSSCSVPLPVDHSVVGALNLYSATGPFRERDEWAASQLARQAAVTLSNVMAFDRMQALVGNLTDALSSRDTIGQAKGIIMERQRCTPDAAFDVLRIASQRQNIKLRDLAQQVVDTGTWEPLD